MASWSAIETRPGFETVSKQRLAHTQYRLLTISAESFLSRRVKKASAARVSVYQREDVFCNISHHSRKSGT